MKVLLDADQLQRRDIQSPTAEDIQAALAADQKRAVRVREIVSSKPLETITDLIHAGTILMHGQPRPDDVLTAMFYSRLLVIKVQTSANTVRRQLWTGLLNINQHQLFGTQSGRNPNTATIQKLPTNTALISDAIRKLYCVSPISQQQPGVSSRLPEC